MDENRYFLKGENEYKYNISILRKLIYKYNSHHNLNGTLLWTWKTYTKVQLEN